MADKPQNSQEQVDTNENVGKDSGEDNTVQDQQPSDSVSAADEPKTVDEAVQAMKNESAESAADNEGNAAGVTPPPEHFQENTATQPTLSTKGSNKPVIISVVAVLVLVLLGFGAYAAYAQVYMPQRAPVAYFERLSDFDSGDFRLHSASTEDMEDEFNYEITVDGQFEEMSLSLESVTEVVLDVSDDPFVDQDVLELSADLDFMYMDDMAYVRTNLADVIAEVFESMMPGGAVMLAPVTDEVDSGMWYYWEVDEEDRDDIADMLDMDPSELEICTNEEDQESLEDYLHNQAGSDLEIIEPRREDWFGVGRNEGRAAHYSGTITAEGILPVMEGMAEATSEDCISEEDIQEAREGAEDSNVAVDYDIYSGRNFDELVITVRGPEPETPQTVDVGLGMDSNEDDEADETDENIVDLFVLSITTSNYNGDVDISAPEESESLEALFERLEEVFMDGFGQPQTTGPQPHDDLFMDDDFDEFEQEFEGFEQEFQTQ